MIVYYVEIETENNQKVEGYFEDIIYSSCQIDLINSIEIVRTPVRPTKKRVGLRNNYMNHKLAVIELNFWNNGISIEIVKKQNIANISINNISDITVSKRIIEEKEITVESLNDEVEKLNKEDFEEEIEHLNEIRTEASKWFRFKNKIFGKKYYYTTLSENAFEYLESKYRVAQNCGIFEDIKLNLFEII